MKPFFKNFLTISIVLVFFIISLFSLPLNWDAKYLSNSPDENLNFFHSKIYSESGSFSYQLDILDEIAISPSVFMPRDGAIKGNKIVPQGFIGIYLLGGTIYSVEDALFNFITPIAFLIILIIIFLITRKLFSIKVAYLSLLASSFLPFIWKNATTLFFNHTFSLLFYLLGVYYTINYLNKDDKRYLIFLGLFFSIAILFRYTYLFLVVFIMGYIGVNMLIKKEFKYLTIVLLLFFVILLPILIFNNILYGGIFNTGYNISLDIIKNQTGVDTEFFQTDLSQSYFYFVNYLLVLSVPFFILGFMGLFKIIKNEKDSLKRMYAFNCLFVFLLLFFYFSGRIVAGYDSFTLDSSFIKYLLPAYALLIPFFSLELFKLKKDFVKIFLFLFVLTSFILVLCSPNGIIDYTENYKNNFQVKEMILSNTSNESIVISSYYDKLIIPERISIAASLIGAKNKELNAREKAWEVEIDEKELVKVIVLLKKGGREVYLVQDRPYFLEENLNLLLYSENLKIIKIAQVTNKPLFKVTNIDSS